MIVLIFVVTLSVLVFCHELGHFLAAKKMGVRVEEFGFGYPPRLWGKKKGETLYSINAIPFGGFVRLTGQDAEYGTVGDVRSFAVKSPLKRAVILLAGVAGNLLLGWFLFSLLFGTGMPEIMDHVRVVAVEPDSVAAVAGIELGDLITQIDEQEIRFSWEVSDYVGSREGEEIWINLRRDDQELVVAATPRPLLGIQVSNIHLKKVSWFRAPVEGLREVGKTLWLMVRSLGGLLRDLLVHGEVPEEVAGPVGIAHVAKMYAELGLRYFLQFMGILSLNLALINLLPLPALDGGRLLFVLIEGVTRRRVNHKFELWLHRIGMILLISLMILITIRDIGRF